MTTTQHGQVDYVLGLADDALVSAQRMGWWISRAPQLEEDLALANIGLDLLGQARSLLSHAGRLEGEGRDEDDLAYWRDERDFRNVKLVERPQDDFGVAMARLLVLSTWQSELYAALQRSSGGHDDAAAEAVADEVDGQVGMPVADSGEGGRDASSTDRAGSRLHLVVGRVVGDAPCGRLRSRQQVTQERRAALVDVGRAAFAGDELW